MKYGYAGIAMVFFGILGLVIILMFEFITIDNESEYYTLKEALKASMIESIDMACYRNDNGSDAVQSSDKVEGVENIEYDSPDDELGCNGKLKISEQKLVENFTKRFAASVNGNVDDYTIEFYDIIESPPKASVVVRSRNSDFRGILDNKKDNGDIYIANDLTGILETYYNKN